jgi:hypothetical protein
VGKTATNARREQPTTCLRQNFIDERVLRGEGAQVAHDGADFLLDQQAAALAIEKLEGLLDTPPLCGKVIVLGRHAWQFVLVRMAENAAMQQWQFQATAYHRPRAPATSLSPEPSGATFKTRSH